MSEPHPAVQTLEKQLRMLKKKLERSEWHRVDLENQHDRDQHLYRRLQDDLEAAKREAQIETALERIRAQSLRMAHSSEFVATSAVFHEQLLALGVDTEFSYVWLPDEAAGKHQFWATWTEEADGEPVHRSHAVTYDLDKEEPYTAACFAAWESDESLFVDLVPPADVAGFFAAWPEVFERAAHMRPEHFPDGLYYAEAYVQYGCFGIDIRREPTDEERDIIRRVAVEFERAYTRFLDLQRAEAQAREAQIEAALERVRSRTMGMQSSDELGDVVARLFDELTGLDLHLTRCALWVFDPDTRGARFWIANQERPDAPESYVIPYHDHPAYLAFLEAWDRRETAWVYDLHGDLKTTWDDVLLNETGLARLPAEVKAGMRAPDRVVLTVSFTDFGAFHAAGLEPLSDESTAILRRFAKVFDQTYTRYLDLEQAEERLREAQIETALERLRSRTMAMQSSDELGAISFELVQQVRALGVDTWHCAFNVYDEGEESSTEWGANADGHYPTYHTPRVGVFRRYYEIGQSGADLHVEVIGEDRSAAHYEAMCALPGVGEVLLNLRDSGVPFPESQIDHVAFFKYGYLIFITYEPAPEAHDIFRRFAKVFEQTYTRFLDLQKAEAQAREAQVEAALERVRSRAMGMRSSDELREMVLVILKEMKALAFPSGRCTIVLFDRETGDSQFWMSGLTDADLPERYHVPYHDLPTYTALHEGWRHGTPFFEIELAGEVKREQDRFFHQETEFRRLPEPAKEGMRRMDNLWLSNAVTTHGVVQAVGPEPLSEDNAAVLRRFAKVIDLTYTRVEDIQRAEEQAREAQIEAALERVRGRAMAMHRSDELGDVAVVLFRELEALAIPMLRCGIGIVDEGADDGAGHIAVRAATEDGGAGSLRVVGSLPLKGLPHVEEMVDAWRAGAATYTYDLTGEALACHREVLVARFDMPREALVPERQVTLACPFPAGFLFVTGSVPLSEAEAQVARRLTDVFAFAYARFEELQSAEARARQAEQQASLDRVRAEVASMRTAADLEHVTPLVWKELTALGVPFFRCGVFIVDEAAGEVEAYLTRPDGQPLAALRMPYDSAPTTAAAVDAWRRDEVYTETWDAQQFVDWATMLAERGLVEPSGQYLGAEAPPAALALHFAPFAQGMLYVGSAAPLIPDEAASVHALADAFAVAYARYEDFQRLEAKNREVEAAMAELRATQAQLVQSEKMASLGALTAGIAHEIKNPLNFVTNFAALSRELVDELAEVGDPAERDEILGDLRANAEKIEEHGRRADGIVRSMMEHARSGTGERRAVDLNALVAEYAGHAEHAMRARHPGFEATLALRLDDGVGEVELVPQEIGRVLVNLVDNALDAIRQHVDPGAAPEVTVSTRRTEDGVEVRVSDNGPGMAPEVAAKVFEPFFTTKPTGEGTGLGLSLAHDIVAQGHGGALAVESAEGEGSAFTLRLPAA